MSTILLSLGAAGWADIAFQGLNSPLGIVRKILTVPSRRAVKEEPEQGFRLQLSPSRQQHASLRLADSIETGKVYNPHLVLVAMQINFNFSDPRSLLYVERLPGRLNSEQAAALLGFQTHDIPILVRAGLLKPLGGGPRNCVKYFHCASVERNRLDERWLDKAAKAVLRRRPAEARKHNVLTTELAIN